MTWVLRTAFTSPREPKRSASAAAIRIYDESMVDNMIRVDGDTPEDTDLNLERKEVELIRKNKPRKPGNEPGGKKKKKSNLPRIILLVLLFLE